MSIAKLTQGKNPHVHKMWEGLHQDQTSLYTRSLGLDKELMFMLNVEGPSLTSQSWWHIREFILVKNLMNAVTVGKSLHRSHTSLYTWMFMLAGNLLYVLNEKHPELPHEHSSNTSPFPSAILPLVPYEPSWLPQSYSGISQKGTVPSGVSPSPIIVSLRR